MNWLKRFLSRKRRVKYPQFWSMTKPPIVALLSFLILAIGLRAQDGMQFAPFMRPLRPSDSGWAARVVANGGALPSAQSSLSVDIFYAHLVATGLTNKLISVIGLAPDSIIAATTPIYFQAGFPLWTNLNFGASNLTVNGLTGNTTTKSLQTGLFPASLTAGTFGDNSAGMTMLIFSATNTSPTSMVEIGANGTAPFANWLLHHFGGTISYYCWLVQSVSAGFVQRPLPAPGSNWSGYISGNRTAADAIRIDMVTNGVFGVFTNGNGTVAGNNNDSITNLSAFAQWNFAGPGPIGWSDRTLSFIAIHGGLTFTESSNLWVGVATLRTNLGGGYPANQ